MLRPRPDRLFPTNPPSPKWLNGAIRRLTNVDGIFPNEAAILRPVGTILTKQEGEWAVQRAKYMTLDIQPAVLRTTSISPGHLDNETRPREVRTV